MNRFMVFDQQGQFIYQVQFEDLKNDNHTDQQVLYNRAKQARRESFSIKGTQKNSLANVQLAKMQSNLKKMFTLDIEKEEEAERRTPARDQGSSRQKKNLKSYKDKSATKSSFYEGGDNLREEENIDEISESWTASVEPELGNNEILETPESEEDSSNDDFEIADLDEINQWNRMRLLKMSRNNTCFLFEDRLKQVFRVYKLESTCFSLFGRKIKNIQFRPFYEIDVTKLKMIENYFCGKPMTYERIVKHLTFCGQLKIDDNGNIDVIFNNFNLKKTYQPVFFVIHGSIIRRTLDPELAKKKPFEEYVIKQPVEFEKDGTSDILSIIDKVMKDQTNLLEIELMY